MIEPPLPISGSAFWTVRIVPFTLVSKISSMCSAVILPSGSGLPAPALAKRALHRAGIGPEVGHSGVERFLPAAEDEDEGALLYEALCCGEADAGSAPCDDCNFSFKLSHNDSFGRCVKLHTAE
jgi:hypothetical protein